MGVYADICNDTVEEAEKFLGQPLHLLFSFTLIVLMGHPLEAHCHLLSLVLAHSEQHWHLRSVICKTHLKRGLSPIGRIHKGVFLLDEGTSAMLLVMVWRPHISFLTLPAILRWSVLGNGL
ncbi:uncharacterized protein LOC133745845 [Rosa rugosa]|uniref:uncharacterized protein LOC133745845 n=1 Tax=Rosa rugosa TaxID=74645 RepID=UPI002B408D24|nr:uncharacterized protein LOC133745845 [Rosa rugosa]